MHILTISGSARCESSNKNLLLYLSSIDNKHHFQHTDIIRHLPLYKPELDQSEVPKIVKQWRQEASQADAIVIATPEYIHNVPAILKNALEWVTTSGEFNQKPILAITYTPHPPRGKKSMQSLLWSLEALEARVVASMDLYHSDVTFDKAGSLKQENCRELLKASLELFEGL